uniref:Notch ligand N-terminal domain-containing protein n=1 Tax=Tetranychus urticae TaxID=32264 RepID=T1JZP4_TETUR
MAIPTTFNHIDIGIHRTAECKTKCNISLKICLRHYKNKMIHQIKFNFTWVREFAITLEAFHTSGSGRDATKKRLLMHSFQEAVIVSSAWKEKTILTNQTIIVAQMRVLCDRYYFGEGCFQKCSPCDYCDILVCAGGCHNGTCKTPGKCACTMIMKAFHVINVEFERNYTKILRLRPNRL